MSELVRAIVESVRGVVQGDGPAYLHEPRFGGNEAAYLQECLDTTFVSSVGAFVDRFERDLEAFTGAARAVVTVNGTAALHLALVMAGVQAGDEVLVPTLTFVATANAVSLAGAIPHLVDAEPVALGVDVPRLEAHLQEVAELREGVCFNKQTGRAIRALVPVHIFGLCGDLQAMVDLCQRWGLALVEDAAESLGTTWQGQHTGRLGVCAAMSFNGNKIVTTGGGGALLTDDEELGARAKHLSTTARVAHRWSFLHDQVGFNYRMPNLNAALGCAQLEQIQGYLECKRRLAHAYRDALAPVQGASLIEETADTHSNYWLCAMMLESSLASRRDEVLEALDQAGLHCRPLWTPMHRLPMYAHVPRMADLGVAEDLEQRVVNLPSSPFLAPGEPPCTTATSTR